MINIVQIIKINENPAFAVIPFDEFERISRLLAVAETLDSKIKLPLEVSEMHALKN